jgi:predicted alpha/beta superfamily hydrolase
MCVTALFIVSPAYAVASDGGEPVVVGQRFHIQSQQMGEMRSYLVHLPTNYGLSKDPYPVLIVLDGDDHFRHVSATVDFLAAAERIPQMIVVGIPNTDRGRDVIPPVPATVNPLILADGIGGPEKFLAFIGDELIPEIDRRYRTRPFRTLVGHSDAGLFVIYSLITKPELFNGYISISPAFSDNRGLPKQLDAFLPAHKDLQASLFMSVASETSEGGVMAAGAWEISSYLQEKAARSNLRWQVRRYPDESHMSTTLSSFYDGVQAIFDGWSVRDPFGLYEQAGFAGMEKQYAALSKRMGFTISIPQSVLTRIFVSLEGRSRFDEADAAIKKMDELYPNSSQVHYYAGRLYGKTKDEPLAVKHLTKCLTLSPSDSGCRRMLKEHNIDAVKIVPEITLTPKAQAAFVGRYGVSDVELEVLQRDGKLYAKTSQREYSLQTMTDTKFYYVNGEDVIDFHKDNRGRIDGLVVQSNSLKLTRLK